MRGQSVGTGGGTAPRAVPQRDAHLLRPPAGTVALLWGGLLLAASFALEPAPDGCNCTHPVDFPAFLTAPLNESCCLNFTGSNVTHLDWGALVAVRGLRQLYLSHCGITAISNAQGVPPALEVLHLSHNLLESLPRGFLEDAPNLKVLYLDGNQLRELPASFLKASTQLQELHLGFNALTSLPPSLLHPSLLQLQLSNNSWECSCALLAPGSTACWCTHSPASTGHGATRSSGRPSLLGQSGLGSWVM